MGVVRIEHYQARLYLHLKGGRSEDPVTWAEKAAVCKLIGEDPFLRRWCSKIEIEPGNAHVTCAVPEGTHPSVFTTAIEQLQLRLNVERSREEAKQMVLEGRDRTHGPRVATGAAPVDGNWGEPFGVKEQAT